MSKPDLCVKSFYLPFNYLMLKVRNGLTLSKPELLSSTSTSARLYSTGVTTSTQECHVCHLKLAGSCASKSLNNSMCSTRTCLRQQALNQEIEAILKYGDGQLRVNEVLEHFRSPRSLMTANHLLPVSGFVHGSTYLPIIEMQSFPLLQASSSITKSVKSIDSSPVLLETTVDELLPPPTILHSSPSVEATPSKEPKEDKLQILAEDLSVELPHFLSPNSDGWHNFMRYTQDVQLVITLYKQGNKGGYDKKKLPSVRTFTGVKSYRMVAQTYRMWCRYYLNNACFEMTSVNPDHDTNVLEVRWRVVGFTPVDVFSTAALRMDSGPTYYDFISYLHVNEKGLIWRHEIENVMRFQDSQKQRWKEKLSDIIQVKSGVGV